MLRFQAAVDLSNNFLDLGSIALCTSSSVAAWHDKSRSMSALGHEQRLGGRRATSAFPRKQTSLILMSALCHFRTFVLNAHLAALLVRPVADRCQSLIIWAATSGRSDATTCGWDNPS
jgi:hypothetical protein